MGDDEADLFDRLSESVARSIKASGERRKAADREMLIQASAFGLLKAVAPTEPISTPLAREALVEDCLALAEAFVARCLARGERLLGGGEGVTVG